jgi:hypothetical protein
MKNKLEEKLARLIQEVEVSNLVVPELNIDSERKTWLKKQGKVTGGGLPEGRENQASGVFEGVDASLAQRFANELHKKVYEYYLNYYSRGTGVAAVRDPEFAKTQAEHDSRVEIKPGSKYVKINVGSSGKFMMGSNGHLYFIKGYGTPDLKKDFGSVENILKNDFDYDGYSIVKKGSGVRSRYGYAGPIAEGLFRDKYKVQQNPKDKKWYVLGYEGKVYMPVSDGFVKKEDALVKMKRQAGADRDARKSTLRGETINEQPDKIFQVKSDFGNIPSAIASAKFFNEHIDAPYVNAKVSTLGGEERVSIIMVISLDEKLTWGNGILQNSRNMGFRVSNDGTVEQLSLTYKLKDEKFRKTRVTGVGDAVSKINKYLSGIKQVKDAYNPVEDVGNYMKKKKYGLSPEDAVHSGE